MADSMDFSGSITFKSPQKSGSAKPLASLATITFDFNLSLKLAGLF